MVEEHDKAGQIFHLFSSQTKRNKKIQVDELLPVGSLGEWSYSDVNFGSVIVADNLAGLLWVQSEEFINVLDDKEQ